MFSFPFLPAAMSINLPTTHSSSIFCSGVALTTSYDTSFPPFPPIMLMIPGGGQGVADEGLGLFDQLVKRLLQVVEFMTLFLFPPSIVIPFVALDGVHLGDQAGRLTASPVFRSDPPTPPNGSINIGSDHCDERRPCVLRLAGCVTSGSRSVDAID